MASLPTSQAAAWTESPAPAGARRTRLSGWGRYPVVDAELYRPEKLSELAALVAEGKASVIARGAGRAYGDAAINQGARVLDLQRLNRMLSFDYATGILRCEAGVTIAEILEVFLPRGFFPPVSPGTRFVTLGGSLAADVHGKNHHCDSSLSNHVLLFQLLLASGEVRRCSREQNSELFWATAGGMGLTGIILEVELRLLRVPSAWISGETVRADNADQALEVLANGDSSCRYSLAWIDCARSGANLGRSVIHMGNFAVAEELNPRLRQQPYLVPPRPTVKLPFNLPGFALNSFTVRGFNSLIYSMHTAKSERTIADYQGFFYPLDAVADWNRLYGRRGFVQYQCVWPEPESRAGLIETIEAISRARRGSFLTVLKRFGAQEGMLAFPMPGYTLALDFPVDDGLFEFLNGLDAMVLKRGGRVYLAKDARMQPEALRAMYPNLARWQAVKATVDPNNRFSSSLSRRVGLVPG